MKPRVLALALMAAGATLSGPTRASDDFCSRLIIYSVQQVCQFLGNGLTQCQPVGMAGPAPGCEQPGGPRLFPMPLAAPTIQMPPPLSMPPAMANPYLNWTYPASALPAPRPVAPPPAAMPMPAPGVLAMPAPASKLEPPPASGVVDSRPAAVPVISAPDQASAPVEAPVEAPLAVVAEPLVQEPSSAEPVPPMLAPMSADQAAPASLDVEPVPVSQAATSVPDAVVAKEGALDNLAALPAARSVSEETPVVTADATIDEAKAHFPFDSAELTEVGRAAIDAWLAQAPRDARVRLIGHADRLGPAPYNLRLSQRRAEAVRKYLLEKGLDGAAISIVAKGEAKPLLRCPGAISPETIECLAPNRRVEINLE